MECIKSCGPQQSYLSKVTFLTKACTRLCHCSLYRISYLFIIIHPFKLLQQWSWYEKLWTPNPHPSAHLKTHWTTCWNPNCILDDFLDIPLPVLVVKTEDIQDLQDCLNWKLMFNNDANTLGSSNGRARRLSAKIMSCPMEPLGLRNEWEQWEGWEEWEDWEEVEVEEKPPEVPVESDEVTPEVKPEVKEEPTEATASEDMLAQSRCEVQVILSCLRSGGFCEKARELRGYIGIRNFTQMFPKVALTQFRSAIAAVMISMKSSSLFMSDTLNFAQCLLFQPSSTKATMAKQKGVLKERTFLLRKPSKGMCQLFRQLHYYHHPSK